MPPAKGGIFVYGQSMSPGANSKAVHWGAWGALVAVIVVIVALFARERLGAGAGQTSALPIVSIVRDFSLTNQLGREVTLGDVRGKVWIANIIFTRCPGPCPRMTHDMARLQDLWPKESDVRFVTISTDPDYDTPQILKRFAERFKADDARWFFLTGPKEKIVEFAVDNLKLTTVDKSERDRETINDLFIHSTISVIVDKRGQVRGIVEWDTPEFFTKTRAIVDELLKERL